MKDQSSKFKTLLYQYMQITSYSHSSYIRQAIVPQLAALELAWSKITEDIYFREYDLSYDDILKTKAYNLAHTNLNFILALPKDRYVEIKAKAYDEGEYFLFPDFVADLESVVTPEVETRKKQFQAFFDKNTKLHNRLFSYLSSRRGVTDDLSLELALMCDEIKALTARAVRKPQHKYVFIDAPSRMEQNSTIELIDEIFDKYNIKAIPVYGMGCNIVHVA